MYYTYMNVYYTHIYLHLHVGLRGDDKAVAFCDPSGIARWEG